MTVGGLITFLGVGVMGTILLIGFIQLLKRGTKKGRKSVPPPPIREDTRKCPKCAETIQSDALVCKHCGHQFRQDEVEEAKRERAEAEHKAILEQQRERELRRLRRKSRRLTVVGWLVTIPAAVCLAASIPTPFLPDTPRISDSFALHLLAWMFFWILFSLPLLLGIHLIRKSKRLRSQTQQSTPREQR